MRENALFEIFRGLPALASILVPWLSELEFRTFYKKEECFEFHKGSIHDNCWVQSSTSGLCFIFLIGADMVG